jgi:hypothetical protein
MKKYLQCEERLTSQTSFLNETKGLININTRKKIFYKEDANQFIIKVILT